MPLPGAAHKKGPSQRRGQLDPDSGLFIVGASGGGVNPAGAGRVRPVGLRDRLSRLYLSRGGDAEVGRPGNTAHTQDIGKTTVTAASETLMPNTRRDVGDNGSKRYVRIRLLDSHALVQFPARTVY